MMEVEWKTVGNAHFASELSLINRKQISSTEFVQTVSVFAGNANTTEGPRHERKIAVEDNTRFTCGVHNPCGWSVYSSERTELYFTVSPCDCRTGMVCRRYRDNINIAAYEYRCMNLDVLADQQVSSTDSSPSTE
ncbi:hypothetical protein CDAR_52841 [Caerostris darwini]|uniref:Uncharacterized protein n=1 Tax=Caerostris darwini TaxID=1538125 RepID=A0AAV4QSX0_9ARAC|nr:hypothetical protein CDAR_52841 [Caerostris darwini]